MNIIEKLLNTEELINQPPVLIDIGASGQLNKDWEKISKYSICLAFDADERDFEYTKNKNKSFKKLHIVNSIVADFSKEKSDFYLTKYPHCSSLLEPNFDELQNWAYGKFFEIQEIVQLKTTSLKDSLDDLGLDYVDWYKSDSQGIDLRLFKNLGEPIYSNVIVAEFEPGFINTYKNEDLILEILEFISSTNKFWLSDFIVKGSQRVSSNLFNELFGLGIKNKLAKHLVRKSPGWAEVIFFNNFNQDNITKRNLYMAWIISTIKNQHGFAVEIAEKAKLKYNEVIFDELINHSKNGMVKQIYSFKRFWNLVKSNFEQSVIVK